MAITEHLTVEIGADFSHIFDDIPSSINLTGATARMSIRYPGYGDAVLASDASEITFVISVPNSTVTASMTAAVTDALRASLTFDVSCFPPTAFGVYDLEIVESGGTVHRFAQGKVALTDSATR